ncbi:MAG: hypothetical protein RIS72_1194, partial [Pseudomonadota bacterium]
FALFKGAQSANKSQETGFANAIVAFEVQPLAWLKAERNA